LSYINILLYLIKLFSFNSIFSIHESSNSIDHVLDELLLSSTESSLVGDIENSILGLGVLTMDTSDLDIVGLGDLIELGLVSHEFWELDMD